MHEARASDDSTNDRSGATSRPSKQISSRELFGDTREIRIDHDGQEYRLRQTRNGKLILTK